MPTAVAPTNTILSLKNVPQKSSSTSNSTSKIVHQTVSQNVVALVGTPVLK